MIVTEIAARLGKGLDAGTGPADDNGRVAISALIAKPLSLFTPADQTAPFLFASPHSGRLYPQSFLDASRLDPLGLRRSEDAFVDELFACAPALGAGLLSAHFPRAYVDVNRAESELDPTMFDGPIAAHRGARSARVAAGLGVIPRIVREGMEIYRARLPAREVPFRLDAFYRPYHQTLANHLDKMRACFGTAILIDCHSMPPLTRGHDIVLGDCHGAAAAPALTDYIQCALIDLGFAVGRNTPYAGGYTTSLYGQPTSGVHAVQIEINRALYLDEKRMEKTPGFDVCAQAVRRFVAGLVAAPGPWRA